MLRNIVLALLLANLLVFAWQRWIIGPDFVAGEAVENARARPLVLLNAEPAPPRRAIEAAPGPVERCVQVGPFSSSKAAGEVQSQLEQAGRAVRRDSREGKVWIGYWVQLTGFADRAATRAATRRLAQVGVRDTYVIAGDPELTISLGIFRNRDLADSTAALARQAGLEPVIGDRFRTGTEHWVIVTLDNDTDLDLGQIRLEDAHIIRALDTPCDGGLTATGPGAET